MASTPPAPTYASTVAQMSALINSWQTYIDQQRSAYNGDPTAVITSPAGQPAPGYYPLTEPSGVTVWVQCPLLIQAQASAFNIITRQSVYPTALATDSGKTVLLQNTGGTTNVNFVFPAGLPIGWNAIYVQWGTQTLTSFAGAAAVTGPPATPAVTLLQDQSLAHLRSRYSLLVAMVPAANQVLLQGSMIA